MRTTLVTLVSFALFCSVTMCGYGQNIQLTKTFTIDKNSEFQVTPKSFYITEDGLFLLPDYKAGNVKILEKDGNNLKFIKALGPLFGRDGFLKPAYILYNKNEGRLGIIDDGSNKTFVFDRMAKVEFSLLKNVLCKRGCYDVEFDGSGEKLVISGYVTNEENMPFDLYSINIENGEIKYLLPSHEKYGLKNFEEYVSEYRIKQTIPAIGTQALIDIDGDNIFFVWFGSYQVTKINLDSGEKRVFGKESDFYTKPVGAELAPTYKVGEFKKTSQTLKKYSRVRDIFATPRHVFVVYETGENAKTPVSHFRLQTYSPEGNFISDVKLPGEPGRQMCIDKDNYELYAFSKKQSGEKEFAVLKYKINITEKR